MNQEIVNTLGKKKKYELLIIAKKLRISGFSEMRAEELRERILQEGETRIRAVINITWWDRHKRQVFGWASVVGVILTIIIFLHNHIFTTNNSPIFQDLARAKSESIDGRFNYTLYFNKTDKKLLDEHYSKEHAYGGTQFDVKLRNFIDRKLSEEELDRVDFAKDGEKIRDFYCDLAFIRLLSRFYWLYADWWDIHISSVRRGDGLETSVSANKPNPPCISVKWNDLLETLDRNDSSYKLLDEFSQDFWIKEMKAPPETKVGIETSTYKKVLSLKNPFVGIFITFKRRGGSVGLCDYQWLLGYDNKKNNEFWSEHFEVACEAKFEKERSLHPEMIRYERWAETMFTEVQYQFDDKSRLKRARDYRDLIGQ